MSKMPAKKKSCFQITSVTQAQVAGVGATDDTESLDDPDESRTEDVSSEMYDMSRAEYEPAGTGEVEAHILPAGQLSALSSNPLGEFRKLGLTQGGQQHPGSGGATGLPFITQPGVVQSQAAPAAGVPANTSQSAVATSSAPPPPTSTVSCMSRFRVIKLDHGTGEPFRRGRWTCTEFYEKDSSGSAGSRTVDSIRHANATTLDPAADRDSGLGQTGGSVVALVTHSGQGLGSTADALQSSSSMHPVETLPQHQQQIHHQSYSARQPGVSGSAAQSAFSSSKPTAVPAQQQAQPAAASLQPSAPQSVLPVGQNGLPQSSVHIQKSPIMPSTAQPVTYPPQQQQHQQLPMGHHLSSQPPGLVQNQMEYYQQQLPGLVTGQSLTVSVGPQTVGQVPSAIMPAASGGASVPGQVGDVAGAGGGSVASGQLAQSLVQQQTVGVGDISNAMLVVGSALQQQYATADQPPPHSLHPTSSGVQNVPAIAASSSVPTTVPTAVPSASSAAMPNVTTFSLPPGQIPYLKTPGAFGAQGLLAAGFGQVEGGGGRRSEGLINAQTLVSGKEPMKPFMPESLQVATPTVNSLFGIHIPVDGDEDSASGISIVAIDNKIEQAMDLVKSHLMYAVREEVEVLKEQIKELFEKNSVLERENAVLKSLANNDQLSQLTTQLATTSSTTPPQQGLSQPQPPPPQQQAQPPLQLQQPQLLSQQQAPLQVQLTSAAVPPAVSAAASTPAAAVAALAPGFAPPASSLAASAAVTHPAPMPP